ncbi:hypothetical protein SAMN05216319_3631 [Duganella sp. CF402]|uniref:CAAX prenyl protease-related protein n=1 Tax=unclassified Duganella TaxID=2636909 RepID=UPI0008B19B65|nr:MULTISPECIES: CAAX prenyl protease-related protein [unclassified Duganella]RZT04582.1 hypothetical protein EV582_5474 [Duganella sp. BK701]SEM31326.1 hypothetical protein SAMN05216319_3631 [Duganella sp. CF402]
MPTLISTNSAAWPRILPFAIYMAFIVVADLLGRLGLTADELLWLYPLKIGAVVLALCWGRRHYTELHWQGMDGRWWLLSIGAGLLVLVLWLNLDTGWMVVGTSAGFDPSGQNGVNWPLALLRAAGAALVVPVMEELFWRSFLLRWLVDPRFLALAPAAVTLRAFAITAVLFGIEHNLWLAGMLAGVVYAGLYMRSQNLWTAIVAHAVTNGGLSVWILATKNWTYW